MKAMVLQKPGLDLELVECAKPTVSSGQVLVEVSACGVCRTDLHIVDGDLSEAKLPIVPGHEIVGRVAETGAGVEGYEIGARVGIPWLGTPAGAVPIV